MFDTFAGFKEAFYHVASHYLKFFSSKNSLNVIHAVLKFSFMTLLFSVAFIPGVLTTLYFAEGPFGSPNPSLFVLEFFLSMLSSVAFGLAWASGCIEVFVEYQVSHKK